MLAVDTNVLIYAHRAESDFHEPASLVVRQLSESLASWALPWPCVHEFYSIVTHPRIFNPASTVDQALDQIDAWCASPSIVLLTEASSHRQRSAELIRQTRAVGPLVHDAKIAAMCIAHGVDELITLDRDFSRFPQLRTRSLLEA